MEGWLPQLESISLLSLDGGCHRLKALSKAGGFLYTSTSRGTEQDEEEWDWKGANGRDAAVFLTSCS